MIRAIAAVVINARVIGQNEQNVGAGGLSASRLSENAATSARTVRSFFMLSGQTWFGRFKLLQTFLNASTIFYFSPLENATTVGPTNPNAMQTSLKLKLSAFMFLQYFIWGLWYVSMATFLGKTLGFEGGQIGLAYGAFAIGADYSPFFVGLIADRYFASEKLLAFLGILGGALLFVLPKLTTFSVFYPMLILDRATYVPTLALGNSLSLHHLANPKRDFPLVKTLSAVGWIAGGVTLSVVLKGEQSAVQFYLAGAASIVLGLFSLTLPHTPPKKTGKDVRLGEILGLDALALLKKPSFAIFIGCMFLICVPLYFYFVNMNLYVTELGWSYTAAKMSLAQVSDVVFLIAAADVAHAGLQENRSSSEFSRG